MAGITTNNGWTYPTSTDLVTNGASAMQTLATGIDTSTGKGLIAWQTWSPVLSNGWGNGNSTYIAQYCKIGKTIHWLLQWTVGSTATKSATALTFSLPPFNSATGGAVPVGVGIANAGTSGNVLATCAIGTTSMVVSVYGSAGTYANQVVCNSTVPGTWTTGDILRLSGTYESA